MVFCFFWLAIDESLVIFKVVKIEWLVGNLFEDLETGTKYEFSSDVSRDEALEKMFFHRARAMKDMKPEAYNGRTYFMPRTAKLSDLNRLKMATNSFSSAPLA